MIRNGRAKKVLEKYFQKKKKKSLAEEVGTHVSPYSEILAEVQKLMHEYFLS